MTKRVYTIPPDAAFIDRLAEGLWKQAGGDPFKLSEMLILLPTRRACRYLREALPRITKARASLLPRMRPIGDLDEDELYFAGGSIDAAIPPAMSPLRRQLLLAQLIRTKDQNMPLDQAAQLAAALGSFLDETQIERRDLNELARLAPEHLARHWQETLEFLKILTENWPKLLAEEGGIDPAERRNRVIDAQAEAWRKSPPAHSIIAAGSTGSLPATADLLDVIASLPQGAVILPGLDTELDEDAWQAVEETHPQYGLKLLLDKFGLRRTDVELWPICAKKFSPRVRLLQESMRPAEATEAWRELDAKKIPSSALKGLSRLTLDNAQEEAQSIALIMRGALEKPGRTAALVTADRALAERVAQALARWGIAANDSAGASLATQPAGSFLLDILAAAAPGASPVDTLSLLKHPLAACGLDPAQCRAQAREAEILVWRATAEKENSKQIRCWLEELKQKLRPLTENWSHTPSFADWIERHREIAVTLAASHDEKGGDRLWRFEAGESTAEFLADLQSAAEGFPPLQGQEYAAIFAGLLRAATLRPSYGQHPRLSILGPLEARLLQPDLIVLGGLNEGSWPPEAAIDPWMSRPMKAQFGLPLPERRIGLSAHDFVQLACAPDVILTRARRAGNAPTVPSRFLSQLETVLRALDYRDKGDALAPAEAWDTWAQRLDQPAAIKPCAAPAPRPPAAARPRALRVTDIGIWRRNPYAIYARYILGLEKLEPLETDATAADKGLVIHKALEIFLRRHGEKLPPQPLDELLKIGRETFAPLRDYPQAVAFWWPRFERIASWFIEREVERRAEGIKNLKPEARGAVSLKNNFILKGRADRIDRLQDGTLAIIDYKTGGLPTQADVRYGLEPQLPLLALIAAGGGFEGVPAAPSAQLAYWKLSGGAEAGEECNIKDSPDMLMEAARMGLENLIARFADASTPYEAMPKPNLQPRYDDYGHLARLAEWGRTVEDT